MERGFFFLFSFSFGFFVWFLFWFFVWFFFFGFERGLFTGACFIFGFGSFYEREFLKAYGLLVVLVCFGLAFCILRCTLFFINSSSIRVSHNFFLYSQSNQ
ncbi:hypothetical protein EDC01DRAFT_676274 [Geopyxis carbonaria]|nr:hypothetical protein EDC01DRAFT_676274 [Geopyxis carbonaria]